MTLSELTRESVLAAIREFDALGRDSFLAKYGFGRAQSYFLVYKNRLYDSKAIAGVAHGFLPGRSLLTSRDFAGGERTVEDKLTKLGFTFESPSSIRSPPWARDELILALELYFRHRPDTISKSHPEVLKLSEVLNALPLHGNRSEAASFRNANGVYMKLCNFLRLDPGYRGAGLQAGSKGDEEVWAEFAQARDRLRQVAAAIRASYPDSEDLQAGGTRDDVEEDEFPEGRILHRLHRSRERSRRLREEAKRRAMKKYGRIFCIVCRFDFAATYGALGEGFIECHHTKPVSELAPDSKTKIEDIALLCANCHRMVHRRRPWLTLEDLGALLSRK